MGHRLSKIYTRTGDDGSTGLGDGTRVDKDSRRVNAYGTVDELNATIGMLLAEVSDQPTVDLLTRIQHELFDLGGELCMPGYTLMFQADIDRLEADLDQLNEPLPPLKDFILPAGGRAAATCHLARTVARRAEREVWALNRVEKVAAPALKYLNRLSDLLFVLARVLARRDGNTEQLWHKDKRIK
jgi:cob(I)alamin adenosyltransferase